VDCGRAGKLLCSEVGISNYPTIKYGDPDNLEEYDGALDFDALAVFARESLRRCGPSSIELCDKEQRALLDKFAQLSQEELDTQIGEKLDLLGSMDKALSEEMEEIGTRFQEASGKTEALKAEMKKTQWLMRAVLKHRELAQRCGPLNIDACADDDKRVIQTCMTMSSRDLDRKIAENEAMLLALDKDFSDMVDSLQAKYDKAASEHASKKTDPEWKMMKAVLVFKQLQAFQTLSEKELASQIEAWEKDLIKLDDELKQSDVDLQARTAEAKRQAQKAKEASGLQLMKAVLKHRQAHGDV
jgi:hypothetical protein